MAPVATTRLAVPDCVEIVQISVPEDILAVALARFGQIKVYRADDLTVVPLPVELSTAGTRITLEPNKTSYQFVDLTGSRTKFYAISHYNPSTGAESDQTYPQLGDMLPELTILSVQELKDFYLFGVNLTEDTGKPYPDSLYVHYIRSAVDELERALDVYFYPRTIIEEGYDFFRHDFLEHTQLRLDRIPIISVDRIQMVLPNNTPVIDFRPEWFHVLKPAGQVHVIPGSGDVAMVQLGFSAFWLPYLSGIANFLPDVFKVDYQAGFPIGQVPPLIKDLVGKRASFGPLNIAGDLIAGAGIASTSLSIDGLSQSISTTSSATNAGYGARLVQYYKEMKDQIPRLRKSMRPLNFTTG